MAIEDWMPTLETLVGGITGMDGGARSPYPSSANDPGLPHSIQEKPIAIITVIGERIEYNATGAREYTKVQITVFVSTGSNLAEAQNLAVPFIQKMRDKLAANISLSGLVDHILPPSEGDDWFNGPGAVSYNGVDYTGIIFRYDVKEDTSADFTVSA